MAAVGTGNRLRPAVEHTIVRQGEADRDRGEQGRTKDLSARGSTFQLISDTKTVRSGGEKVCNKLAEGMIQLGTAEDDDEAASGGQHVDIWWHDSCCNVCACMITVCLRTGWQLATGLGLRPIGGHTSSSLGRISPLTTNDYIAVSASSNFLQLCFGVTKVYQAVVRSHSSALLRPLCPALLCSSQLPRCLASSPSPCHPFDRPLPKRRPFPTISLSLLLIYPLACASRRPKNWPHTIARRDPVAHMLLTPSVAFVGLRLKQVTPHLKSVTSCASSGLYPTPAGTRMQSPSFPRTLYTTIPCTPLRFAAARLLQTTSPLWSASFPKACVLCSTTALSKKLLGAPGHAGTSRRLRGTFCPTHGGLPCTGWSEREALTVSPRET